MHPIDIATNLFLMLAGALLVASCGPAFTAEEPDDEVIIIETGPVIYQTSSAFVAPPVAPRHVDRPSGRRP